MLFSFISACAHFGNFRVRGLMLTCSHHRMSRGRRHLERDVLLLERVPPETSAIASWARRTFRRSCCLSMSLCGLALQETCHDHPSYRKGPAFSHHGYANYSGKPGPTPAPTDFRTTFKRVKVRTYKSNKSSRMSDLIPRNLPDKHLQQPSSRAAQDITNTSGMQRSVRNASETIRVIWSMALVV